MKRVILRMKDNALQVNFHPELASLAKQKSLDVAITVGISRQDQAEQVQEMSVSFKRDKIAGEKDIFFMIETHLRYLMLYETYNSIKKEAKAAGSSSRITVDKSDHSAQIRVNLGSILTVRVGLKFFAPQA